MVSSRELHIRLNRLFRFMNILHRLGGPKGKDTAGSDSFYYSKKDRMLSIAAWKKGYEFSGDYELDQSKQKRF